VSGRLAARLAGTAASRALKKLVVSAPAPASDGEIERARPLIEQSPWTYPNLLFRRDMAVLFSERGNALVMFGHMHRTWVAMGDAIGPPDEAEEVTRRFCGLCREARSRPAFFEVSGAQQPLYRELGLTLIKLGEEARVPLAQFDLASARYAALRQACARVRRRRCRFEIVPRRDVPALLPQLLRVSQGWLERKATHEKGFSNASFDARYLACFDVALVRSPDGVLAFANLWQSGGREELSVDLMRHLPEAPNGSMDFLFSEVMRWGRAQGFRWFNFGVAPLSGLDGGKEGSLWDRIGTLLYRHGEHFYNFQGLRSYKDKFRPVWTPRYLASPGGAALPVALFDVAALIAGGVRAIVSKRV
jgi:phosphatidylglycerol lysyltransferase